MRSFLCVVIVSLFALSAFGQELKVPTLSPLSEITQEVGLSQVKLSYARPSAKGRKVFGDLVPFGEVWRTGANASTKLTFTEDVKIEGNPLKAGTYALYSIPGDKEWTVIIHTNTRHRSIAGDVYKPAEDAFRFKVPSGKTSNYIETFTIGFGDITTKSLKVAIAWENTEVKFKIDFDVDAGVDKQIAAMAASPTGMTHSAQFLAAEYYLHNNKDLNKADEWIRSAMEKSAKNSRYGLLRAKILAKAGKRDEALKVVAEANAWAKEAKNANYVEQTQQFWDSIKK
ncbi:MAG: DUF2911 domain-containing protein [Pyrinomonadaceae bacterium]|nr:DUF2911 domain-containing protein [Acidobacteriota bacterium]MBP7475456.1 DUF2911 domain-containing protein [Pyrinomonadaceae bacterium]MBP9108598.1 DUF2911 domain-containing protein [Pyrinomonadaceae bacterium]